MPPSAMIGTLREAAACAHSRIDEIIGMPTPATTRVVQIEPAPMPTFTASTPASISASVPDAVATLPATMSVSGNSRRTRCTMSSTFWEWPCAVSITSTSTPAWTSAVARSMASRATPMAAPHRSRPSESFDALGYLIAFWMSLTVIRPLRRKSRSTTSSFSTLCWCRMLASLVERGADRHGEERVCASSPRRSDA